MTNAKTKTLPAGIPTTPHHPLGEHLQAASLATRDTTPLSPQQWKVLSLLGRALTNKEIARELDVADSTVKAYVTQLFKLMGCRNRTELALLSLRLAAAEAAHIAAGRSDQSPADATPAAPGVEGIAQLQDS